jgi:hypothetical protein
MTDRRPREMTSAIYGTILVTAIVAALSEYDGASALETAGAVILGALVLWLAHVYAALMAASASGRRVSGADLHEAMVEDWPIVQSAVPALVALVLGAVHVLTDATSIALALWAGVAALFVWGWLASRHQRVGLAARLLTAGVNGALGLLIVALKVVVH